MPSRTGQLALRISVFAVVGVILLSPIVTISQSTTGMQSVANESHGVDFEDDIDLNGYDITPGSETVYGYNDTSGSYEQAPAADYSLDDASGKLSLNSSSTLFDEGEQVKVSYEYRASDSLTGLVVGFVPIGIALVILVGIAANIERLT